ncbi:MAG: hypothetical protein RIB61_11940 [Roseicyclus sp.]
MTSKTLLGPDGQPLPRTGPDLSRRKFAALAGTSLLATPFVLRPGSALADLDEEQQRETRDQLQRLFFQGGGLGRVFLAGIIVVLATGALYYRDVSQGATQFDEDRAGTQSILGGIFRPTISERLANAQQIGTIHLFDTFLVCLMTAAVSAAVMRNQMLVTHRLVSWQVGRLRTVNAISGLPALNDLRLLRTIGAIWVTQQTLLAILPPPDYRT